MMMKMTGYIILAKRKIVRFHVHVLYAVPGRANVMITDLNMKNNLMKTLMLLQLEALRNIGIPITCKKCMQNFLHHVSYHLDFHDTCKFCRRNRYKTYAETRTEFEHDVKKQSDFLKSVCPHCDSKFCEPHLRKKHI